MIGIDGQLANHGNLPVGVTCQVGAACQVGATCRFGPTRASRSGRCQEGAQQIGFTVRSRVSVLAAAARFAAKDGGHGTLFPDRRRPAQRPCFIRMENFRRFRPSPAPSSRPPGTDPATLTLNGSSAKRSTRAIPGVDLCCRFRPARARKHEFSTARTTVGDRGSLFRPSPFLRMAMVSDAIMVFAFYAVLAHSEEQRCY